MTYKPGDTVKITTNNDEFVGVLLPRPEILKGDSVILKLESGYNIGIDKKNVKKIELLKKYISIKEKEVKIKHNPNLPKVSFLSYGGTISSKVDYNTGGVFADLTAKDFVIMCPELEDIANISTKKIGNMMSEDMAYNDWILIAKEIETEIKNGADGVVLTQGTDTLHYTTAILSFFLKDVTKPVIVTASQRSIDRGSSDAFINLICAIKAAGHFDGAGIYSCMHGSSDDNHCLLIRGTKVRKMHTSRRDAFRPINELPIAKIYHNKKDIEVINENYIKKTNENFKSIISFEKEIAMVYVHPGINPDIIDFHLNKGVRGIVIMGTALGHVPSNGKSDMIPNIKKAIKKGVFIVVASQTIYGRVHPLVYTNLRKLSIDAGVVFLEDMLPEVAYVKLGWALSQTKDLLKLKEMMLTNYSGEINTRIDEKSFLY